MTFNTIVISRMPQYANNLKAMFSNDVKARFNLPVSVYQKVYLCISELEMDLTGHRHRILLSIVVFVQSLYASRVCSCEFPQA